MKEILFDLLGIGCGLALFVSFIIIKVTGGYEAVEDNPLTLWAEIGLSLAIVIIGIDRFWNDMK